MKIIYTEIEKRAVLTALKSKGNRQPSNWRLIHSESCQENELKFDHSRLLDRLTEKYNLKDEFKFFVDVVSNPNEQSRLDRGVLKVRYRYVLSAKHQGESKIKPNSREFCVTLINQDKLFRIEDIDMMSFRGVNPIAKKNYSIFRLRGHWNCRHTWQREVYLIERDNSDVENNELISKTLEMSEKKDGLVAKMKAVFASNKEKISMSEAVALSREIISKADFKFKDYSVGDKTLRVEGEEITVGAALAWVDQGGEMTPVEESEITVVDGEKTVVIVVKDSAIEEIKEPEVEEEEQELVDMELKEGSEITMPNGDVYVITNGAPVKKEKTEETSEMKDAKKFASLEAKIDKLISENDKAQTQKFSDFEKKVLDAIAKIPAVGQKPVKQSFSSEEGGSGSRYDVLGDKPLN